LLGLNEDGERERLAQLVAERGLSVRETEKLVAKARTGAGVADSPKPPELTVVSEVLRTQSVHVQLQQKASGKGKLIVEFSDAKTRDAIVAAIKGAADG
jgi:ParB-like chromosome segregation protein Spo0J